VALVDLEQANLEEAATKLRSEVKDAEVLTEICDVSSYEQVQPPRRLSRYAGAGPTRS